MTTFTNCNFQINFYSNAKGMPAPKYSSPKKIKNYYSDDESESEEETKSYIPRNDTPIRSRNFVFSTRPGTALHLNGTRIIFI